MLPVLLAVALHVPTGAAAAPSPHRLTVRPAPAPTPALRYHLLPEVRDLNPGNPVQWYVRSFAEQRLFFYGKESVAERARFRALPLAELRTQISDRYGGSALSQADWAARLDTPDWQVLERIRDEGTALATPELPALRILATALQVRFRGEVARGRFDDAVHTAQTILALARHLDEYPSTSGGRLALAVAHMALDTLEEFVQQPGAPNLYWALTDLPSPLLNLRRGLQGDRAAVDGDLRGLRDDVAMTDEQLEAVVGRLSGRAAFARQQSGRTPRNLRAILTAGVNDAKRVTDARIRLLAGGTVDALGFPALQLILLDERREFDSLRDEQAKLLNVPLWQSDPRLAPRAAPQALLLGDLLPPIAELRRERARVEQRIAVLRCVEGLRLHASGSDGKLPRTLADLAVPTPADPFTGKPFGYEAEGGTARLLAAPGVRYEITLAK